MDDNYDEDFEEEIDEDLPEVDLDIDVGGLQRAPDIGQSHGITVS